MQKSKQNIEPKVMEGLTKVFQAHGFGGATLTLFTAATGLKRPSLYHRFPDGKLGMALAVLEHGRRRFNREVLAPLYDAGDPHRRLQQAVENMQQFYDGGEGVCLLDVVLAGAKGEDREQLREAVAEGFRDFIAALEKVATDLGADPAEATRRGEDAVVRLEGSLVLARGIGETTAFERTLKELPDLMKGISNTDPE